MDEIIEALSIFKQYMHSDYMKSYPFHCEHDILYINCDALPLDMKSKDVDRLDQLGFEYSDENRWHSWKFGSF